MKDEVKMQPKRVYKQKIESLIAEEKKRTTTSQAKTEYAQQHNTRFKKLVALAKRLEPNKNAQILDIGRSELTYLLSKKFAHVTSLGFSPEEDEGGHRERSEMKHIEHITFDLNTSNSTDLWPDGYAGTFDLIMFSETIEHLHVAPEFVLLFLRYLLKEEGKIVVTTPNAASIYSRIRLIFGTHPYEKIRLYKQNPGHFREYTVREMRQIGKTAGLQIDEMQLVNYKSINYFGSLANFKYMTLKPFEYIPNFRSFMIAVFKADQHLF